MKKALVACLPDPSGNPRPNRVIRLLHQSGYRVSALSKELSNPLNELYQVYSINEERIPKGQLYLVKILNYLVYLCGILKLPIVFYKFIFSKIYKLDQYKTTLINEAFDLVIVEDLNLLPFVYNIKQPNTIVIFDAREYYPREIESSFFFRHIVAPYKKQLCKWAFPKLDAFYTVSDGLADLYEEEFNIRPDVVRSTPDFQDLPVINIDNFPVKLVHHGVASRDRYLEEMIEIVRRLDGRFTLNFYLKSDDVGYIDELKDLAKDNLMIVFNDPVPFLEINKMLSSFDLGFYFLKPTGFNTTYNLPNKFFEFIQARLGMVIGPSPEMAKLGEQYGVALVSQEFSIDSMVESLKSIELTSLNKLKQSSSFAATELCWEKESERLLLIIEKAFQKKSIENTGL